MTLLNVGNLAESFRFCFEEQLLVLCHALFVASPRILTLSVHPWSVFSIESQTAFCGFPLHKPSTSSSWTFSPPHYTTWPDRSGASTERQE